jgi:VanZ family protein
MGGLQGGTGPEANTSARLALALLGYFILVTAVITLSPFDFAPRPVHIFMTSTLSDMVANVALFLPIGFLLRSLDEDREGHGGAAVAVAAGLSILLECAQLFLRDRYVSPIDVLTNTCGAYAGVLLRDRVERWAVWHPDVVGRLGLDIPLVGLLYLLVPQLWLSGVGLADDPRRFVTTLLLGCAGSIVVVALHRHQWYGGKHLAAAVVPPIALLWFMVGSLPALATAPRTFSLLALAVVVVTVWLLRRPAPAGERRFETETLRRFLPVFGLYVVIAALWPPFRSFAPWHGSIGFIDRLNDAGVVELLMLLEQVGAFTLLGYAAAEWRGRRELSLADDLPGVALLAVAGAVSLELAQGLTTGPGASLLRALLSASGTIYGAAVYHLARAHVRALRRMADTTVDIAA